MSILARWETESLTAFHFQLKRFLLKRQKKKRDLQNQYNLVLSHEYRTFMQFIAIRYISKHKQSNTIRFSSEQFHSGFRWIISFKATHQIVTLFYCVATEFPMVVERLPLEMNLSNLFLCCGMCFVVIFAMNFHKTSIRYVIFVLNKMSMCWKHLKCGWWFKTIKSDCHWMTWMTSICGLSINSIRPKLAIAT